MLAWILIGFIVFCLIYRQVKKVRREEEEAIRESLRYSVAKLCNVPPYYVKVWKGENEIYYTEITNEFNYYGVRYESDFRGE